MIELRFHGRGGQGAVMASRILASAFVWQGKFGCSFPMFGFERRGAPVTAFARFDDKPIREKTQVYSPDCLVVLDPSQSNSPLIYEGLKPGGILVLNTPKRIEEKPHENLNAAWTVDANAIALEEIGIQAPNTSMLGAFAAATQMVELGSIASSLEDYFEGEKLDGNIRCAERGFRETKIVRF
jgi:2-oxoacid:acceptor oxidoreductase gamma subunit (pyruvate/2-ketoisovalerate family)